MVKLEKFLKDIESDIKYFLDILTEAAKFYKNPKKITINFIMLSKEEIFKRIIIYLFFYEIILTLLASTLIENVKFNLLKIVGATLLDFIYLLPGVIIIFLSLKFSKVSNAFRKSIIFYIFVKVFIGIFISCSYIFFISFEIYTWYIIFGICSHLMLLLLLILPGFYFSDSKKQLLKIFISTLLLTILFLYINSFFLPSLGFQKEDELIITFDPIFAEFDKNISKTKFIHFNKGINIINEFREIEKYIELRNVQNLDLIKLEKEWKFNAKLKQKTILDEINYFGNKDSFRFRTNKIFFNEIYIMYLRDLSLLLNKYHELFKLIELEKAIDKINLEIETLDNKIKSYFTHDEFRKYYNSKLKLIPKAIYDKLKRKIDLQIELIEKMGIKKKNWGLKYEIWHSVYQYRSKVQEQNINIQKKIINYYTKVIKIKMYLPLM